MFSYQLSTLAFLSGRTSKVRSHVIQVIIAFSCHYADAEFQEGPDKTLIYST